MSAQALVWTHQAATGTYTAPGGWLIQTGADRGRWEVLRHGTLLHRFDRLVEAKGYAAGIVTPVQAAELPPPTIVSAARYQRALELLDAMLYGAESGQRHPDVEADAHEFVADARAVGWLR